MNRAGAALRRRVLRGVVAGSAAGKVGIPLGSADARANRAEALGALLGYATGVGVGAAYGLLGPRGRLGAVLAGAGALLAANGPMVAGGYTDPRSWGVSGWVSDLVPHAAYGLVTAATYDALRGRR